MRELKGEKRKNLIKLLNKTAGVKKNKPGSYMRIMKEIYEILDEEYIVWDDIIINTKYRKIKILK